MPHKGTPIRYGLKPMRNRMQGAENICELGKKLPSLLNPFHRAAYG